MRKVRRRALVALARGALCLAVAATAGAARALVQLEEGRRVIEGVVLLRDAHDDKAYYYLPRAPRLARAADGETLELLCVKYVGAGDAPSGGLLHALVELDLPDGLEATVARELAREVEGATLRGPVPLLEAVDDGAAGVGAFRVVSGTLSSAGDGGLTRALVTSGHAPLAPGAKAVVAARLTPEGATLLWETFASPTSDVSVAITAYYEAAIPAYRARVSASMDTVYAHFSEHANAQLGYSKAELRTQTDALVRDGGIAIEVLDRSSSAGVDAAAMDRIVDLVATRLAEQLFDATAGWARAPEREAAAGESGGAGRREPGWLDAALQLNDQPYVTDVRYELKRRSDVQRSAFELDLTRAATIRVPFETAGNLGGLYAELGSDPRYFRVVNLADPVFETRTVHFQIDGAFLDAFQDTLNFVSVSFRKRAAGRPEFARSLVFTHDDVKAGRTLQSVDYPRLGEGEDDWRSYEYRVSWSVRGRDAIAEPAEPDAWIRADAPAVALAPPLERRTVEIDADRALFAERGVATGVVEFAVPLGGRPKLQRKATLRASDAEASKVVSIFHDRGAAVGWRVTWHGRSGVARTEARGLDSEYLYLVPPVPPEPGAEGGAAREVR
ncbi:MAG: hypothetical protein R3E88_14505 [Myxococcota bacterium]